MIRRLILKITIFFAILIFILINSYAIEPIAVPETDVNLRIIN